jgi:hypothetical protein
MGLGARIESFTERTRTHSHLNAAGEDRKAAEKTHVNKCQFIAAELNKYSDTVRANHDSLSVLVGPKFALSRDCRLSRCTKVHPSIPGRA